METLPSPVDFYSQKRHWFHLSSTLNNKQYKLVPRYNDEGFNRSDDEPDVKRICVSPTVEQCLVALPYDRYDKYFIYRTKGEVIAREPNGIFDSEISQEGWITSSTWFIRVGVLDFSNIKTPKGKKHRLKTEAASYGCPDRSKKLYKWWKKINPWKFVKMDSA